MTFLPCNLSYATQQCRWKSQIHCCQTFFALDYDIYEILPPSLLNVNGFWVANIEKKIFEAGSSPFDEKLKGHLCTTRIMIYKSMKYKGQYSKVENK